MSEWVDVTASDGFTLKAYVTRPSDAPKGALVLVQEIFGINKHIQSVADGFAQEGYVVIAPALFDRIERDVQLDYDAAGKQRAFSEFYPKLDPAKSLLDIAAAYHFVAAEDQKGIGVIGYCYGGLMAWLSATRGETEKMQPSCTVGYYAGGIGKFAAEEPSCPVLLHFGEADTHIGADQIDAVRNAHPEVEIYTYEGAGHAFTRKADPESYNEAATKLATERTLAFLNANIA
jgi:carboxymethylenebutenolidase